MLGNSFADTYAVDGVVFKVDLKGADTRQHYVSNLRTAFRSMFQEWTEAEFNAKFKVKMFYMDRDRYRAIVKVSVYGAVATQCRDLPAGYIAQVNEVHLKAYAVPYDETSYDNLRDALYASEGGGQQLSLFGAKPQVHAEKGDGKGWRIGDRNSDYHFVGYRRKGQRLGIEVRVKDRPAKRMGAEAVEMSAEYGLTDVSAWSLFFTKLAKLGGDRLDADFARKSVQPGSYIKGFTDSPHDNNRVYHYRPLDGEGSVMVGSYAEHDTEE